MRYPFNLSKIVYFITMAAIFLPFIQGCGVGNAERAAELYTDAIILNDTNEKDLAIEKLKEAVDVNPQFSLAHSMLGDMYFETGKYEASEKAYESATELNKFSFYDFFNLGKVRVVLKKFSDAVKAYVRACQIDPEHADAHLQAARCYFELKDEQSDAIDNALEYGIRAKELNPSSGEIESLLGNIYQERKDNQLAIESYKRALEMQGNDPDVMVPLAVSYFRTRQNESARDVLDSVVAIDPQNALAYRYLGVYYIRVNNFEQALENYLLATHFNDTDWDAHKGLGVAYMLKAISTDDAEARAMAVDHWKTSLAINPRQPKLRELLKKYSN